MSILLEAVNPERPFCSIVSDHKRKLFRSSDVQKVVIWFDDVIENLFEKKNKSILYPTTRVICWLRIRWINTKYSNEMAGTCNTVTGKFKSFELLSGVNQGAKKWKKNEMLCLGLFVCFYLPEPQLNSKTTRTGKEVKSNQTCVNPQIKFCHVIHYSLQRLRYAKKWPTLASGSPHLEFL